MSEPGAAPEDGKVMELPRERWPSVRRPARVTRRK
jgi:hypothetical protein